MDNLSNTPSVPRHKQFWEILGVKEKEKYHHNQKKMLSILMYEVSVKIEILNFSIFIGWREQTDHADWPKFENRLSNGTRTTPKTAYGMGRSKLLKTAAVSANQH